jgi:hypothetical protein
MRSKLVFLGLSLMLLAGCHSGSSAPLPDNALAGAHGTASDEMTNIDAAQGDDAGMPADYGEGARKRTHSEAQTDKAATDGAATDGAAVGKSSPDAAPSPDSTSVGQAKGGGAQ